MGTHSPGRFPNVNYSNINKLQTCLLTSIDACTKNVDYYTKENHPQRSRTSNHIPWCELHLSHCVPVSGLEFWTCPYHLLDHAGVTFRGGQE